MKQSEKKARYVCVVDVAGRAGWRGMCGFQETEKEITEKI